MDTREASPPVKVSSCPYLFRLVDCEHPLVPSSRHLLEGLDRVIIGRDDQVMRVERRERDKLQELRLGVMDPRISSTHAQLRRVFDKWILEDTSSRNGTLIKGARIEQHPLQDGDIFELGHTFFLFRMAQPLASDERLDLDAVTLERRAPGLATLSPALTYQLERLVLIAPSSVEVLILGESGTGKELIARALGALSGREGPFIPLNCGALQPSLVESELFGHHRGAFTGAVEARPGLVRSAHGGTLFLDEIGELSLSAQAALLRVLQERQVMPVGATRLFDVDFRLCCATHRNLQELVEQGRFRADLLARISGFTMELPPLRERREDLGLLLGALLQRVAGDQAGSVRFAKEAMRMLLYYDWPLNVREVEHCLKAATRLAVGRSILVEDLPKTLIDAAEKQAAAGEDLQGLSPEEERHRAELIALLKESDGKVAVVARRLGKDRVQIRRWLRRYKIDPNLYRPGAPKGHRR